MLSKISGVRNEPKLNFNWNVLKNVMLFLLEELKAKKTNEFKKMYCVTLAVLLTYEYFSE